MRTGTTGGFVQPNPRICICTCIALGSVMLAWRICAYAAYRRIDAKVNGVGMIPFEFNL